MWVTTTEAALGAHSPQRGTACHERTPQAAAKAWGSLSRLKCTIFFLSQFQQRSFLGRSGQVRGPSSPPQSWSFGDHCSEDPQAAQVGRSGGVHRRCLCGVTAQAGGVCQEGHPPGPALTVWPPPRLSVRLFRQVSLSVSPHLRSSASTVKALLSQGWKHRPPRRAHRPPARLGLPAPPAQSRGGLLEVLAPAARTLAST